MTIFLCTEQENMKKRISKSLLVREIRVLACAGFQ